MKTIRNGSRGEDVKKIQRIVGVVADGVFGAITEEAVKVWQAEHGLLADGVVGPKTWSAMFVNNLVRSRRKITEIIVHCTGTREGEDVSVEEITRWHRMRGFATIGYHYVVSLDGKVMQGRDVDVAGAHCKDHNARSIGVCYVGGLLRDGKFKDTRTDAQKNALKKLIADLKQLYPGAKVLGHRDTSPDLNGDGTVEAWEYIKWCPCFDAIREYM